MEVVSDRSRGFEALDVTQEVGLRMKTVENGMAKELRFSPEAAPDHFGRIEGKRSRFKVENRQERRDVQRCFIKSKADRMVIQLAKIQAMRVCALEQVIRAVSHEPYTDRVEKRPRMHRPNHVP